MKRRKHGFSLVEVNLAIMVIGLGMLVLFGLFPTGLREGENALINTHCALFADAVFNGLRAEASQKTWSEWRDWRGAAFEAEIPGGSARVMVKGSAVGLGRVEEVEFPANSDETIFYVMEVSGEANDMQRRVWLWIKSAKHATTVTQTFKEEGLRFYSGVFYSSGENE